MWLKYEFDWSFITKVIIIFDESRHKFNTDVYENQCGWKSDKNTSIYIVTMNEEIQGKCPYKRML